MTRTERAETDFLLRRAEEESVLAIRADATAAGAVHLRLSMHYTSRALAALAALAPDHGPVVGAI
jgi:hypothetical protein